MQNNEELAKKLYRKGLTIPEISNLTNMSISKLTALYKSCFESGELEPRRKSIALKPRPPKGQKKIILTQKQQIDPEDIICGWDLRNARRRKGLTQKEFAELVGASQVMVSHWEKGAEPSPKNIRKIKEFFSKGE